MVCRYQDQRRTIVPQVRVMTVGMWHVASWPWWGGGNKEVTRAVSTALFP